MKLEVGKYYRTRAGRKVGPIFETEPFYGYKWKSKEETAHWDDDGVDGDAPPGAQPSDLVAEWTVTRKDIVPGVHGDVEVSEDDTYQGGVGIYINTIMDVTSLSAAIATLTEIRDALEQNQ